MTCLYRINEFMEYSTFVSFRKQFFHKKSKEFLEESESDLKYYDRNIKNDNPDCLEHAVDLYGRKAETLILLKQFDEANKCLNKIIEYNYPKFNLRAYFLKGFISYILKDYNDALKNYIVALYQSANSLEEYWIKDIFKEIRITNNQLYGYENGLHKAIEQIKLFLEKHPETTTRYFAKYEIANINYLLNKKQAMKEFNSLLEDLKHINKEDDIDCYIGGSLAAKCFIGKIKCCLNSLRNKKLTKDKENQLVEEIEKSFELLDKHFIEKTDKSYSGRIYFPFAKFNIVVYRLKHSYYKLLNKETDFYNKAMQLFREKKLKRFCFSLTKEQLNKFIRKYKCSHETYKKSFENLLFNNNIDATYFKEIDTLWNVSFTKAEIEDLAINTFPRTNNYVEKYKYLLNKYIPNLNNHIFNFENKKPICFFISFGFTLDFIKYLIEEKKLDYKKDKDEILKASIHNGKDYNEYLKNKMCN